ncbi:MAG: glycosyltransferase family 39 protein, partial [Chloroflexi bacterium]|nr:glycosyltransferase family 39 protein [Chloroflexota bacterium]
MSLERTARPKTVTRAHGLLLALCFTAYILRLFHLDAQSLWYDEGFSAWVATQPFDQIIARTSTEMNPPLYYFLLHIWIAFCGQSEFSLRFLSLMPSVMLVPMFYLLVRRLLGSVTGWIAALLATFSPMYVWYAQEARVYALLTLLTLMSSYFLWLWTERATWRRWLALLLCNVVSVYLHYFGFFIIAFQLVYFLILWTRQETRWATLGTGLAVPTLTLVASVPWLQFALRQIASDTSYVEGTLPLFEVLRKAFALFSTGHSMLEQDAVPAAGALVLFAIVGWVGIGRLRSGPLDAQREDPFRRSMTAVGAVRQFLVLYLLTPFTLFYLVAYQRPKFHPRYLMIASPPFLILVSACIAVLWLGFWRSRGTAARRGYISLAIGSLIAILVGSITLSSLANLYFDVRFSKDDFRSAVAAIRANRADGQLTLLVSGHMFPIYLYYDPQGAWVPLPDEPTLSTQRVLGYNVANDLNAKLRGKTDVWLLLWQDEFVDPAGFVTTILDSQAQRLAQNQSFWGVRLMHYRVPPGTVFSDQPQIQQPLNVNYGGEIALLGYNLPATASPADAGLNITLYWRALKDLHEDYSVSLRVRDSDGRLVGKLDARPVAYEYPTTRWRAGDVLFGKFQIPLELGAPPSNYRLEVIVYSSDSVEGLDILDAGGKRAGKVAVLPPVPIERPTVQPAVDKLQMKRPLRFDFGNGIEMLGMDVQQVNPEPGEPIEITIYWRARSVPSSDFRLVFE